MQGIQLSFFDPLPELRSEREILLDKALLRGSGFEGGPLRIYAAFLTKDQRSFTDFLREEFGVGGHSMDTDRGHGFVDYGSKGLQIRVWKDDTRYDYSWQKVAARYSELIGLMMFPEEKIRKQADAAILTEPHPRMHYDIGGG